MHAPRTCMCFCLRCAPTRAWPQVAAAIRVEAAAGIGAVKRALDASGQPVDYGAIKVQHCTARAGQQGFGTGDIQRRIRKLQTRRAGRPAMTCGADTVPCSLAPQRMVAPQVVAALMASRSIWFGAPAPAPAPAAAAAAATYDLTAADEDSDWGGGAEELSEGGGEWINLRAEPPPPQQQQQQQQQRLGGLAAVGPHGKPPLPANHQQHLHPPSQLSQQTHQQQHHPGPAGCSTGPGGAAVAAAATASVSGSQQSFAMHDSPVGLDGISAAPGAAAAAATSTACDDDDMQQAVTAGAGRAGTDGGCGGATGLSGRDAAPRPMAAPRQGGGAGSGHDAGFVFDTPARHGMSQSDTPDFIVRQSPGATTAGYGVAVPAASTAATSTADRPTALPQQQPQMQTQPSQPGATLAPIQAQAMNNSGAGHTGGNGAAGASGTYRPPIISGGKRTLPGWFGAGAGAGAGAKRQAAGPAAPQPAAASQVTQPSQPASGQAAAQRQQAPVASPGACAMTPAPRVAGSAAAATTPGGTPVTREAVLDLLQKVRVDQLMGLDE